MWFVYMIRTAHGSLYTGITTDVERRFREHRSGGPRAAKSLRGKGPLKLVYSRAVGNRSEALKLEYRIRQLDRNEKERLIN